MKYTTEINIDDVAASASAQDVSQILNSLGRKYWASDDGIDLVSADVSACGCAFCEAVSVNASDRLGLPGTYTSAKVKALQESLYECMMLLRTEQKRRSVKNHEPLCSLFFERWIGLLGDGQNEKLKKYPQYIHDKEKPE